MAAATSSTRDLIEEIHACRICRDGPEGTALPHEPRPVVQISPTARLLIAGQAPGTRVHESGRPFTDPSGDRLRDWLGMDETVFYDAGKVAIVPMGFCFPGLDAKGGDLPPRRECAPHWRSRVISALPDIRLILVIGQYAQAWHLGGLRKRTLTETVFEWRSLARQFSPPLIPLPHPSWRNNAWIRNNPWFETDLLPALRAEVSQALALD